MLRERRPRTSTRAMGQQKSRYRGGLGPISGIGVGDKGKSRGNTAFRSGALLSAMDGIRVIGTRV